ncbi:hypothetical protein IQ268_12010 [Oculatella sp. LEGE 06141]|uniref:hypothetical protein n=1 Tax=Oculatella sp. LEGE 06141 TaxID=1828648 RepID=UPI00187E8D73|nr:hypothetical protein [Oculatella sp. LEGE 06141]MBE9179286.1 hypothetical protein [Oculatella sp. LEGE 06141]
MGQSAALTGYLDITSDGVASSLENRPHPLPEPLHRSPLITYLCHNYLERLQLHRSPQTRSKPSATGMFWISAIAFNDKCKSLPIALVPPFQRSVRQRHPVEEL